MASTSNAVAGPSTRNGTGTSAGGESGAGGGGEERGEQESESNASMQRFACTVEGCTKDFAKLSHMKRHVETVNFPLLPSAIELLIEADNAFVFRQHDPALPYKCSQCEKSFKRRDVCVRHEHTIHGKVKAKEIDDQARGAGSPPPNKRHRSSSSSSTAPHSASPALPNVPLAPPTFPPPPQNYPLPLPAVASSNHYSFMVPPGQLPSGPITQPPSPFWQPQWLFPPSSAAAADVSTSFDASLGWGYNDTELDLLGIFGGDNGQNGTLTAPGASGSGYVSPAINWLRLLGGTEASDSSAAVGGLPVPAAAAQQGGGKVEHSAPAPAPNTSAAATSSPGQAPSPAIAAAMASTEADSLATPSDGGGPEAPNKNPWPHVYEPMSGAADPLALPAVANPPPLLLFEQGGGAVSPETRQAMMHFVSDSHKTVGAMYRPEFEGLGVALTELTRRIALWKREQDPRSFFEVSVIQAWLLSSISGLFCGSRKLYQHAEIARAGLATAARRMNLLRESTSFVQDLLARKQPTEQELQAAQNEDELRLRLGWGIYIFDNLVAVLLNLQPVVSVAEVSESTFLPEDTLLPPPSTPRRRFRQTLARLLTEGQLDGYLPPLATTVIQLTLYRLCLDASYQDTLLSSALDVQRTGMYRLVFPPDFQQNPQELLDRIGQAWHASPAAITPLHVQTTALAYHATLQFSCTDFLSLSKVCAGKYGSKRAMDAREAVTRLALQHPVAVRRVLARAVQLSALLERHRYDTPAETMWIADAAMAVWAIVKFARSALSAPPSPLQTRSTIHWSDSRTLEPWIQHGGPLALKNGLGDFDTVTPETVLEKFAERLEDLPWGLAKKYRAVLLQLCLPE
ncbi:hypothetical protein JCM11251_001897 [Rhodosporidiobolus azoricus]